MDDLIKWLNRELDIRDLSARKLSEQIGKANNYVSLVLNKKLDPGVDFYVDIAKALDEPIEKILRLAGILPTPADGDMEAEPSFFEWVEAGKKLTRQERLEILEYADFVRNKRKPAA